MPGKKSKPKSPRKAPEGRPVVIVESPAKARTINKILGPGYVVKACMGHVRDLPERKFGIDVEHGFEPTWQTIRGKTRIVSELRAAVKDARTVYLAPDPDREGEAIAWHLVEALRLPRARVQRVTFNEITGRGVLEAFRNPGALSMPRVNAQQARRFLDRIVGYKISPLLWKKVGGGLSAGRVQSVAVRLIVDREREIQAFKPEEYWTLTALLDKKGSVFKATLVRLEGREVRVTDGGAAQALVDELKGEVYEIADVRRTERAEPAPPPFTTSLLQQRASTQLRFAAKRTMAVAQQLYEGVEVGPDGAVGLITYMRTDSFRVAGEALAEVRDLIRNDFGPGAVPEKPNFRAARKGAQEAHEAIRPTSVNRRPEQLKPFLNRDQYDLYRLIWTRFVASQMKPALYLLTEADVKAGRAVFLAAGRERKVDGFRALVGHALHEDEQILPPLSAGDRPALKELRHAQHFTQAPPRYTEASLVKALERHGIGRPSTYAPILSTIQDRGYVLLQERDLRPTELGCLITDKLVKHFESLMDLGFTARMEKTLDDIEDGERDWTEVLKEFHDPFVLLLDKARMEMGSEKAREAPGEACPKCGKPMLVRRNKGGPFLGCSGYPECKSTRSLHSEEAEGETCDLCRAPMGVKSGKKGRFLACSRYPDCRGARSLPRKDRKNAIPKGWKEDCDKCARPLRIRYGRRGGFIACSGYPECKVTRRFPKTWARDVE